MTHKNNIRHKYKERVIYLYVNKKLGSITISKKLDISKPMVLKILKENNINRRTTSEAGKNLFNNGYLHPMKGRKHSLKSINQMKGKRPHATSWNKGLTKKEDNRIKGGRISKGIFFDKISGYMLNYKNGKLQKQHRIIWKTHKGDIPKGSVIHHIDGNKINNVLNNLKLMTVSDHTKLHWAQGDIRK